jgi:hypothetical protein
MEVGGWGAIVCAEGGRRALCETWLGGGDVVSVSQTVIIINNHQNCRI